MKKIAIIGCGGINSWFIHHLTEMLKTFDYNETILITLYDKDLVEEKNILRNVQNFQVEDLMMEKAECLGKRYNVMFETKFITEENIKELLGFDDIILGVDNHKVRKLIYEFALKNDKYVLDMRAQGTQIAFFVLDHKKDMKYYNEKFFNNEEVMEQKGSCQLQNDVENDHIENGNKIISYFCAYGVYLKHLRNEELNFNEYEVVY